MFLWRRRVYDGSCATSHFRRCPSTALATQNDKVTHKTTLELIWSRSVVCGISFAWRAQFFGRSTLHTLHFTLYALHSTLYTLHWTLYTLHSTLYILHSTLYTLHFALRPLHFTLSTPHLTLYTAHSTIHTSHSTLLHSSTLLHTPHFAFHPFHIPQCLQRTGTVTGKKLQDCSKNRFHKSVLRDCIRVRGLYLVVFSCFFSVWGTFPCYLLRFGAKTCTLLNFGAKICHLQCSSFFPCF